jgi:hypothetical protein
MWYLISGLLFGIGLCLYWVAYAADSIVAGCAGIVAVLLALVAFPSQRAVAAVKYNGHTICVKEYVSGSMDRDLRSAIRFVDSYTGSRMVYGPYCKGATRTLTIRTGKVPQVTSGGRTYAYTSASLGTITIDPHTPAYARKRFFEHELGHAFTLHHSAGCDIMKAIIVCHGRLVPERFTSGQKATLRSH